MIHRTEKERKRLLYNQMFPIYFSTQFLFRRENKLCKIALYKTYWWRSWVIRLASVLVVLVSGWAGDYILMGSLDLIYEKETLFLQSVKCPRTVSNVVLPHWSWQCDDPTQITSLNLSVWTQSRILEGREQNILFLSCSWERHLFMPGLVMSNRGRGMTETSFFSSEADVGKDPQTCTAAWPQP